MWLILLILLFKADLNDKVEDLLDSQIADLYNWKKM
jgi:hypothetical protein